ncbi:MAG: tRNA (guanosine(46)-N7)-methyltransferase TrmB [Clostridia bacterium]|nr:tRNA (guanosine(46)-N7)-methyltransferase TrmB [Clostridia bacterium]
MRMKFKPWAREELETSPFYIDNPQNYKNKWKTSFEKEQELHIELGCGKGNFIAELSKNNQGTNYIAIDLIDAMLGMAKRNVEVSYGIRKSTAKEYVEDEIKKQEIIKNLKLTRYDISNIADIFGKDDNVKRIYINFCNPWPRGKHHKKRLTHERQLNQYKEFLDGEIFFKTDDDNLFEDSLKYFDRCDYEIKKMSRDLASENGFWNEEENIETEHEKMFKAEGIKIKALIAINHN